MLVTTFLAKHDACPEGRAFALQHRTMEQVWEACVRSDWMLWILERTEPMPPRMSRLFACWCARHTPLADGRAVWDLLTEERSRNAVVVAEAYARGGATDVELAAARDAARDAARAAGDAAWAAGDAARGAARGAAGAAARDAARAADWAAARGAARAAGDAAWAAAWAAARDAGAAARAADWAAATAAWAAARDAGAAARDAGAAARAADWAAATAAQCREIRRLIPGLTKWTAPKRATSRKSSKSRTSRKSHAPAQDR
jgi:hypothetical protein